MTTGGRFKGKTITYASTQRIEAFTRLSPLAGEVAEFAPHFHQRGVSGRG